MEHDAVIFIGVLLAFISCLASIRNCVKDLSKLFSPKSDFACRKLLLFPFAFIIFRLALSTKPRRVLSCLLLLIVSNFYTTTTFYLVGRHLPSFKSFRFLFF